PGSHRDPPSASRSSSRSRKRRTIACAACRRCWGTRSPGEIVSDAGHRCEESRGIEFDHEEPVARGGRATVSSIRLRCRAHNQYEAERTFGVEFMRQKRVAAAAERAAAGREDQREVALRLAPG